MTVQTDRTAIDQALAQASTTRVLILESGVHHRIGELVRRYAPELPVVLVADETTWELAGRDVMQSLENAGVTVAADVVFEEPRMVTPDLKNVGVIRAALNIVDGLVLPIAIGSGTINDLTKRAAHEAGLAYAVVATAASMDGYTASGAALIADGVKQTFACAAPFMVIADRDVIAQAPRAMTAAGYGDLLGKITAGADWLIADALGIEPIQPNVWSAVQGPLRDILSKPERYASGDATAIERLFLALAGSGLAIQTSGSSRPASGSEHQFSHYWEMRGLELDGIPVSHGFKVGIGSIVSAALFERLMKRDISTIDVNSLVRNRATWSALESTVRAAHDIPAIRDKALHEMRAKYVPDAVLRARLIRLRDGWTKLRDALSDQLIPASEIATMLAAAGAPSSPAEIGLNLNQLRASYEAATHIRRRYTVFDLVFDLGIFDELVGELFGAGGNWSVAK